MINHIVCFYHVFSHSCILHSWKLFSFFFVFYRICAGKAVTLSMLKEYSDLWAAFILQIYQTISKTYDTIPPGVLFSLFHCTNIFKQKA